MTDVTLPFDPLRDALYQSQELYRGVDRRKPGSLRQAPDVAILSYFVRYGKNPTADHRVSTLEALHDNSIAEAVQDFVRGRSKVVAIMGGHDMARGSRSYVDIAQIARTLARRGFLIVSGGGPGAMEAAHLGAACAGVPNVTMDQAIARLARHPRLPRHADQLVDATGRVDAAIARQLHRWLAPALAVVDRLGDQIGPSLGLPTWLYGYEPTTPLATHTGKYFQNSLREDGLVRLGVQGIIYTAGQAGTVQEVFQDATRNFYGAFCPMVFLSSPSGPGEPFWERTLPVRPLIEALLGHKPGFRSKVLFTASSRTLLTFLLTQKTRTFGGARHSGRPARRPTRRA